MSRQLFFLCFTAAWATYQTVVHFNGASGWKSSVVSLFEQAIRYPVRVMVGQLIFVLICGACVSAVGAVVASLGSSKVSPVVTILAAAALSGLVAIVYVSFIIRTGSV